MNTHDMHIGVFNCDDGVMECFSVSDYESPQVVNWHGTEFRGVNTWSSRGDITHVFKGCTFVNCASIPSGDKFIVEGGDK